MPENNKERVEELQKNIENWKKELEEVWAGKDTDAAEVERRNLRNLISNAEREMSELQPNKANNEINNEEIKPEDLLNELQGKNSAKNAEQNRIKLQIERLKEEREDYKDDKALYEEYGKKIEELENEIEKEEKTQEQKDKEIRTLTKGRMEAENNAKEIEKQIRQKRREIEDIEYGTKESMEEMKLESGENIKQPKVLRIYKEIEELENKLRQEKDKIEEYQKVIDELKGIDKEKKQETRELNPEEIRYFHGQGDYREQTGDNGEDLRKNRLANDEYFGVRQKPLERKEPVLKDSEPKDQEPKDQEPKDQEPKDQESKDQEPKDQDPKITKIYISEKDGKIYTETNTGEKKEIDIKKAKKMKRKNFKRLGIDEKCEDLSYDFMRHGELKSRVNPEIVEALKDDKEAINCYIASLIYDSIDFPFDLTHDLRGANKGIKGLINRRAMNHYAKYEIKCGAKILGGKWNKNNALPRGKEQNKVKTKYQSETIMGMEAEKNEEKEKVEKVVKKAETKAREQVNANIQKEVLDDGRVVLRTKPNIRTYNKAEDVPKVTKKDFKESIEVNNKGNRIEKEAQESINNKVKEEKIYDMDELFEKKLGEEVTEFMGEEK